MTDNQKRKIKRQAHKNFRKQCVRAYKLMAESSDYLQMIFLTTTSPKNYKFVHYRTGLRVSRLFRKTRDFAETASRSFEDFYTDE